jgi:hypothetical protein
MLRVFENEIFAVIFKPTKEEATVGGRRLQKEEFSNWYYQKPNWETANIQIILPV